MDVVSSLQKAQCGGSFYGYKWAGQVFQGTFKSSGIFRVKILPLRLEIHYRLIMPTLKKVSDDDEEILEIEEQQQDEDSSVGLGEITKPFNPKDINIIVEPKTIGQLVTRLKFDEIDLNTEFQRMGNLWSDEKQCRLIESILLRKIPAMRIT